MFIPTELAPGSNGRNDTTDQGCDIDTTLALTQRLMKVLHSRMRETAQPSFQHVVGISETPFPPPKTALDQSSLLHALSTYIRLIEAYTITFVQTTKKFGQSLANNSPTPLPSLQIGAFVIDDPATHISLVIQSALQLLGLLADLVDKLTAPFLGVDGEDVDISKIAGNAIKTVMVTVREHEDETMQKATLLQQCCQERRPRR